jgi:hypothetical protein
MRHQKPDGRDAHQAMEAHQRVGAERLGGCSQPRHQDALEHEHGETDEAGSGGKLDSHGSRAGRPTGDERQSQQEQDQREVDPEPGDSADEEAQGGNLVIEFPITRFPSG